MALQPEPDLTGIPRTDDDGPDPADALDAERALADFYPRVLELEVLLAESRARNDELAAALADEQARRTDAEHHVELLLNTHVYRYLARPRQLYAQARHRLGGGS